MARNIEIKARIESVEAMRSKAAALADHGPIELLQDDTFFTCERGRLKLRALSATEGHLIFYQRVNRTGPKESFFVMASTSSPDTLREVLSLAYGQAGRVRKHRRLLLDSRVVDVPMASNPTFVTLSSLKPFFFNGLQNE
jgi:adenylate cyclase class IV